MLIENKLFSLSIDCIYWHWIELDILDICYRNGNYFKRYGNVSSVINEIRRERRIEFVGEGIRYNDLRRWKMLGHLINGNVPRGAKAQ